MIRNIIFDLGNVLLKYDPKGYLSSIGFIGDTLELVHDIIFGGKIWRELDRGTYTFEEAIEIMRRDNPNSSDDIELVFSKDWRGMITVMQDTAGYLKELKARGYDIYILSNFSYEWYEYMIPKAEFLQYADGQVISGYIHLIKPEKEIYEYLLEKYRLMPDESVFIDDLRSNIEAAENAGIKGILYTDFLSVRNKLEALL